MRRSLWFQFATLAMVGTLSAQEPALSNMYGRGVHAYFGGQASAAHEFLSAAINAGSRDPRAFYFRGLAHQRLGRPYEAQADFRAGAELEHQDAGGVYGVDRALERVQGAARLSIERHRAVARVEAVQDVVLDRNRRSITAQAATPDVTAPGDQVLGEQPANFNNLPAAPAMPPVKGEVDKPFGEPAADPNALPPAKPAQPNPLNEPPLTEPVPAKPAAATPAAPPAPGNPAAAPAEGEQTPASGRALGNALKRAFGGLVPSVPELPATLPLGGEAPPQQPQQPPAAAPPQPAPPANNPFGNP